MQDKPQIIKGGNISIDENYRSWLQSLKSRLQQYQIKAAVRVNSAMLEFYWELGRDIVAMKPEHLWGAGIINQLSLDLKEMFPNQTGFSVTNLKYMKRWYAFYSQSVIIRHQVGDELETEFGHQVGDEFTMPPQFAYVPWRHHVEIMTKCKSVEEALFYVDKVIEQNWSRRQLEDNIEASLFDKQGKALTNFHDRLPAEQGKLAQEILKDPYGLDFLTMKKGYDERQLEDALVKNITRFLLELGTGFSFVGRQIELRMPNGKSFFPDMLFYHFRLKCFVVVELKVVDFIPEFAGKLNFYVTAVDKLLKADDDNQTIGLLICKSKDKTLVEWSFQDVNKPLGVASYELQNVIDSTIDESLPTIQQIESAINDDKIL
ncbi:MAG: DUF1016 family protein [Muribaculaceae bacterium]|nr:DUF1016 family protein [Muribaculaceae bacterium]